ADASFQDNGLRDGYALFSVKDSRGANWSEYRNGLGQILRKIVEDRVVITNSIISGTNIGRDTIQIDVGKLTRGGALERGVITRKIVEVDSRGVPALDSLGRFKVKAMSYEFIKGQDYKQILSDILSGKVKEQDADYKWQEALDTEGRPIEIVKPDTITRNLEFVEGTDTAKRVEIEYRADGTKLQLNLIDTVQVDGKRVFTYRASDGKGNTWTQRYSSDGRPIGSQVITFTAKENIQPLPQLKVNDYLRDLGVTKEDLNKFILDSLNMQELGKDRYLAITMRLIPQLNAELVKQGKQAIFTDNDEKDIKDLVKYFSGESLEGGQAEAQRLLSSRYAPLVADFYYKAMIRAISQNGNYDYEAAYGLYKLFLNGSHSEEKGIDRVVIQTIETLRALDRKGINNMSDAEKAQRTELLTKLKSRMLMTHPETFYWTFYDFVHDRKIQIQYDPYDIVRFRPEGEALYLEYVSLDNYRQDRNSITFNNSISYIRLTIDQVAWIKNNGAREIIQREKDTNKLIKVNAAVPPALMEPQLDTRQETAVYNRVSERMTREQEREEIDGNKIPTVVITSTTDLKTDPKYEVRRNNFSLETWHYYIPGTNIERSFQKIMVNPDRTRVVTEQGRVDTAGDIVSINKDGEIPLNGIFIYERMIVDRARLERENAVNLINTLDENGIKDGQEIFLERYVEYAKTMDPDGSNARIKENTKDGDITLTNVGIDMKPFWKWEQSDTKMLSLREGEPNQGRYNEVDAFVQKDMREHASTSTALKIRGEPAKDMLTVQATLRQTRELFKASFLNAG
ncbi:MAG: hypothetical protein AAB267_04270, partial [Candidatus Desantisbacteria bacterium]